MKSNSEYKTAARQALKGNWGIAAITALVFSFITGALDTTLGVGFFLVSLPLEIGLLGTFRRLLVNRDAKLVDNMFRISIKDYVHKMSTSALRFVYTFLWTLLFIIPGIVKSYAYAMVPYILEDNPDLSAEETIDLSVKMMDGHKWELFCLHLSFLGWAILCIFTFGIGFFFLQPYVLAAQADFYEDLKASIPVKA